MAVVCVCWYYLHQYRLQFLTAYGIIKPQWVKLDTALVCDWLRSPFWTGHPDGQLGRKYISTQCTTRQTKSGLVAAPLIFYLPRGGAEDRSTNNGSFTLIPAKSNKMTIRFDLHRSTCTAEHGIAVFRLTKKLNAVGGPAAGPVK